MPLAAAAGTPGLLTQRQRLAAAAFPAVALLVGVLAPRSRVAAALTLAGPMAAVASSVVLTRAAVAARAATAAAHETTDGRPPAAAGPGPEPRNAQPHLSVLIPARDEAAVIGALIADLGRQDHRHADGTPLFEVILIDDRSTDGTGDVACAAFQAADLGAASRVLRRQPGAAPGKGAALADVPACELRGTAMVVLDADARIDSGFLRRAAAILADGHAAATARRRMLVPIGGKARQILAAVQDDEQTIDGTIQGGRWALRGGSEFRGDGSAIHLDALRDAGGWDAGALCEDLELSSRLFAARGASVAWDPTFVVWEQPVVELPALLRQRLRWAEGLVRRELRVTPSVLASSRLSIGQRAMVLVYSAQSLAPIAALGLLARVRTRRARRLLIAVSAGYAASAATLGTRSLGEWPSGHPLSGTRRKQGAIRLARAVAVAGFSTTWLAVLPVAWLRVALQAGPPHFARTRHSRGFSDPPSAADLAIER